MVMLEGALKRRTVGVEDYMAMDSSVEGNSGTVMVLSYGF